MPNYIEKTLNRFGAQDIKEANSPAVYIPPKYGRKEKQMATEDNTPRVSGDRKRRIQQIVGTLLYYARAVDPTVLTSINKVASAQANPTVAVEAAANRLLQYAKRFQNATIVYRASGMQSRGYSDASYLSESMRRTYRGKISSRRNSLLSGRIRPTGRADQRSS